MKHKIRVFTTVSCPYCQTLKMFLEENGFEFEELDVGQDKEARTEMVKKSGALEVPVVDIDGKFVVGFDKEKIDKLLNIKD